MGRGAAGQPLGQLGPARLPWHHCHRVHRTPHHLDQMRRTPSPCILRPKVVCRRRRLLRPGHQHLDVDEETPHRYAPRAERRVYSTHRHIVARVSTRAPGTDAGVCLGRPGRMGPSARTAGQCAHTVLRAQAQPHANRLGAFMVDLCGPLTGWGGDERIAGCRTLTVIAQVGRERDLPQAGRARCPSSPSGRHLDDLGEPWEPIRHDSGRRRVRHDSGDVVPST